MKLLRYQTVAIINFVLLLHIGFISKVQCEAICVFNSYYSENIEFAEKGGQNCNSMKDEKSCIEYEYCVYLEPRNIRSLCVSSFDIEPDQVAYYNALCNILGQDSFSECNALESCSTKFLSLEPWQCYPHYGKEKYKAYCDVKSMDECEGRTSICEWGRKLGHDENANHCKLVEGQDKVHKETCSLYNRDQELCKQLEGLCVWNDH